MTITPAPTATVRWVESATGWTLNEGQARAVDALCAIAAPYNLPLIGRGWEQAAHAHDRDSDPDDIVELPPVELHDSFIIARLRGELATYDAADLTRLVLAAHDRAVRVSIRPELYLAVNYEDDLVELIRGEWTPTGEHPSAPAACLAVYLHPRQRGGSLFERHPTILQAIRS